MQRGSIVKRIGELEGLVEQRVREELEAVLARLEERLPRQEFERAARIIAGYEDDDEKGGGSWGA